MERVDRSGWIAWAALGGFAVLAVWAHWSGLLPGDTRVFQWLRSFPSLPLRVLATIGSEVGIALLGILLAWVLRRWMHPFRLIGLMILVPALEWTMKFLVQRPRPNGQGWGFPSGHALASLTLALLVAGPLWPVLTRRGKVVAVVVAGVLVAGIAASRVGLRVHWPSDILGGWLLGTAYALWTVPVVRRRGGASQRDES